MSGFAESLLAAIVVAICVLVLGGLSDVPGDSLARVVVAAFALTFLAVISRKRPPRAVRLPPAQPRKRRRR